MKDDAAPIQFKRVDHTALEVSDIQRSISFYCQHFGFKQYFDHVTPGGTPIVYLRLGDTMLELVEQEGATISGCHFALEAENLKAAIEHLATHLPLVQALHNTPARHAGEQGWKRIVFSGPDGEAIELRGPYLLD